MKTLSAREAKNAFGEFLDLSQREPVIVTKRGRPVSVMLSIKDIKGFADADKISPEIAQGIEQGLADAKAGNTTRITPHNKAEFVKRIVSNLAHNQ